MQRDIVAPDSAFSRVGVKIRWNQGELHQTTARRDIGIHGVAERVRAPSRV
jgi:hypothetical protein